MLRFPHSFMGSHWRDRVEETQSQIFTRILTRAQNTVISQKYNITKDTSYSAFASSVPLFTYDTLFPYIDRMMQGEADVLTKGVVASYAKSSGTTTGRSKYIPTPKNYLKNNHLRGGKDIIAEYLKDNPNSKVPVGKTISITGSITDVEDTPSQAGDISALIIKALPWWTSHTRPYTKDLALHASWPHKAGEIARHTKDADIVSLYGVPTWMLEILELVRKESAERTIHEVWPNLEVFFYGGVAFEPYKKRYDAVIGKQIEYRGVYNASEGVIAFEDDPYKHKGELLLCTNHDIFYEFLPVGEEKAVPVTEVEKGKRYAVIITTTSGLWRYTIGDVVEFTSTKPYRLRIVGRTTQYMNAFGEEVVAGNAAKAVAYAADKADAEVREFTAAPTFETTDSQGAHEWIFEFIVPPKDMELFKRFLDEKLKELNSDYEAKRDKGVILGEPIIHTVEEGTFRKYLENKGKLGGQNKVPMLSNEREYIKEILTNQ